MAGVTRRRRRSRDPLTGESLIETPEYAAMLRRLIRRYGERLADADYVDLSDAIDLLGELDEAIRAGVRAQADATSWATVAQGLGVHRQSAWNRWGPNARRRVGATSGDVVPGCCHGAHEGLPHGSG